MFFRRRGYDQQSEYVGNQNAVCNLRSSGINHKPISLPPHTGPELAFEEEHPSFNKVDIRRFDYIFPVVKYAPAHFQPGPVYFGGEAAQIGNQPWNFSQVWTAQSTPKQMDWAFKPSFKGTQSAAAIQVAQQAMSQLLAMRSINSASG